MRTLTKLMTVALLTLAMAAVMIGTAQAATVVKARSNNTFSPGSVTINDGGRVVWKNPTNATHDVDATSNNWNKFSTIGPNGGRTGFTFNNPGTYRYRCSLHSGMTGRVVVN